MTCISEASISEASISEASISEASLSGASISDIKYVCVATEMKLYLPSLKQLIPDVVILGLHTPWEGFITKYKLQ